MFGRKSKKSAEQGRGRAHPAQGGAQPMDAHPQMDGGPQADDGLPGSAGYPGGIKKLDNPNLRFRFVPPKREL